MRLVFVTQELDPQHPTLAQSLDLVAALAGRCDELRVVARDVRAELPANVTARLFEAGSRVGRSLAFERALLAATAGADAVLVHMVPQFAILAAPLAKARRIPLLLWYTHWRASRTLRFATAVADVVLSVDESSFPLHTSKVRGIGHAIDIERFDAPRPAEHVGSLRLLSTGRTARWKGLDTALEALMLARRDGVDVELDIYGPSLTADERAHRMELQIRIAREPELAAARLHDAVSREAVPGLLAAADVFVSAVEPRSGATLDKAVYEAAACRRSVVTTNPALAGFLAGIEPALLVPARDAEELAGAYGRLAAAGAVTRAEIGDELRRRVVEGHSLQHWANAVVAVAAEVPSPRGSHSAARQR